jgi:hypothetical protein
LICTFKHQVKQIREGGATNQRSIPSRTQQKCPDRGHLNQLMVLVPRCMHTYMGGGSTHWRSIPVSAKSLDLPKSQKATPIVDCAEQREDGSRGVLSLDNARGGPKGSTRSLVRLHQPLLKPAPSRRLWHLHPLQYPVNDLLSS